MCSGDLGLNKICTFVGSWIVQEEEIARGMEVFHGDDDGKGISFTKGYI